MIRSIDGRTTGSGIVWPDHKRIAVMLTFDFDAEYLRESRAQSKGTHIGFSDRSRGKYGPREGLSRCLNMLDTFGVKGTFFIPDAVIENYREQVERIHERGHEIAYHSYECDLTHGASREEEEARMEKGEELIRQITGKRPVGHRGPGPDSVIYPFTPELLVSRGYLYSSSMKDRDWAYLWEKDGRELPLIELPGDVTMDDFTYYYFTYSDPADRSMYTNREVIGNWKDEFDGLAEEGDKIFVLRLHPQMIGRASRIAALGEFIAYMQQHGAWIATCEEVARYVLESEQGHAGAPEARTGKEAAEETPEAAKAPVPARAPYPTPVLTADLLPRTPSGEVLPVWPEHRKIAVMLGFDLDADTMWTTHGDGSTAHLTNLSRGAYGPRQGVPRILDMLDHWGVKATFFVPGQMAEKYPGAVREMSRRGHEIGFHGYKHEEFTTTTYEEENATMNRAEGIIRELCGQQLAGHRAPGGVIHDYSLRLFLEHHYIYSTNWRDSDGPFLHTIDGKEVPLVELPKDSIFDDTAYDFFTDSAPERYELKSPREMLEIWKEEFDSLAAEGRMINFVLHPQFIGRVSRVNMLSELIGYMLAHGAWIDTNYNVADYILRQRGLR